MSDIEITFDDKSPEDGDHVIFPDGSSFTRENGKTIIRIGDRVVTQEEWQQHRIDSAIRVQSPPSEDDLLDEFNEFFEGPFLVKADQLISIFHAQSNNPALDQFEDALSSVTEGLGEELIKLCYEVVRMHQRWEQTRDNPTFPFDSLDEGYFCPTCGHINDEVIANVGGEN
jgi:hypothetical protein